MGILLLLSGCGSVSPVFQEYREVKDPLKLSQSEMANSFQLSKVLVDINPNEKIGFMKAGCDFNLCIFTEDIKWTYNHDLTNIAKGYFFETFSEAGFPVVKNENENSNAENNSETAFSTDYLVGGKIIEFKQEMDLAPALNLLDEGLYMKVLWQVYSQKQNKVVFETYTESSAEGLYESRDYIIYLVLFKNIENLLGNRDFYNFIKKNN